MLPFHVPDIDEAEIGAVNDVLRSGWLTTGSRTQQFEEAFRQFVGSRHAIAVNSCTAALHLALEAIGVREGDEVIVPTMTFAATAEVVTYLRARPVFVDCEPDTLNMAPAAVRAAVTPRTKAIVPVHFAGLPCDLDALSAIARQYGLRLIEDAAHALPARWHGRTIGAIGDVTCFSFYATKTITTGEGGMITTDADGLAQRMRLMSLHGISRDGWKRYAANGSWRYEILDAGFKYNLTDIASAIGLEQLHKAERFRQARQRIADTYDHGLGDLDAIDLPARRDADVHAWHLYVVQLRLEGLRIGRDAFIEELRREGVGTSVHFIPLHMQPHYRSTFGYAADDFPVAHAAFDRIVSLPIYSKMTAADAAHVVGAVRRVVTANRRTVAKAARAAAVAARAAEVA